MTIQNATAKRAGGNPVCLCGVLILADFRLAGPPEAVKKLATANQLLREGKPADALSPLTAAQNLLPTSVPWPGWKFALHVAAAQAHEAAGDRDAVKEHYRAALENLRPRSLGNVQSFEAELRRRLGLIYLQAEEAEHARHELTKSLRISRKRAHRNPHIQSLSLCELSQADLLSGRLRRALKQAKHAVRVAVAAGDKGAEMRSRHAFAIALTLVGRPEQAVTELHSAAAIAAARGHSEPRREQLLLLVDLLRGSGRGHQATEVLRSLAPTLQHDPLREGHVWWRLGELEYALGHLEQAREAYSRARRRARQASYPVGEGASLFGLGMIAAKTGDARKAAEHLSSAKTIAEAELNDQGEAACLHGLALLDQAEGRSVEAAIKLEEAALLTQELEDQPAGQEVSDRLSYLYSEIGRVAASSHELQQQTSGTPGSSAPLSLRTRIAQKVRPRRGGVEFSLSRTDSSSSRGPSWLSEWKPRAMRMDEAKRLRRDAENLIAKGDDRLAGPRRAEAYRLARILGDEQGQFTDLVELVALNARLGKLRQARRLFDRAKALRLQTGEAPVGLAPCVSLATVYAARQDFASSLAFLHVLLGTSRRRNDTYCELCCLTELGGIYLEIGLHRDARQAYEESLREHRRYGPPGWEGGGEAHLGLAKCQLGLEELRAAEHSLKLYRDDPNDARDPVRALAAAQVETTIDLRRERGENVLRRRRRVMRLVKLAPSSREAVAIQTQLAVALLSCGQPRSALRLLNRLQNASQDRDADVRQALHHALGKAHAELRSWSKARLHFESAVGMAEVQRERVRIEEFRMGTFATTSDLYADFAQLLALDGDVETAFRITQEGKARTLRESFTQDVSRPDAVAGEEHMELKEELTRRKADLARLRQRGQRGTEAFRAERFVLDAKRALRVSELTRRASSDEAGLATAGPASLSTVRQSLLDAKTALLEYHVSDRASMVYCVTLNGLHAVTGLPGRRVLQMLVRELRAAIATIQPGYPHGDYLYDRLVGSVAPILEAQDIRNLVICPDGVLHTLPFTVLTRTEMTEPVRSPRMGTTAGKYEPLLDDHEGLDTMQLGDALADQVELLAYERLDYLVGSFDLSIHQSASVAVEHRIRLFRRLGAQGVQESAFDRTLAAFGGPVNPVAAPSEAHAGDSTRRIAPLHHAEAELLAVKDELARSPRRDGLRASDSESDGQLLVRSGRNATKDELWGIHLSGLRWRDRQSPGRKALSALPGRVPGLVSD